MIYFYFFGLFFLGLFFFGLFFLNFTEFFRFFYFYLFEFKQCKLKFCYFVIEFFIYDNINKFKEFGAWTKFPLSFTYITELKFPAEYALVYSVLDLSDILFNLDDGNIFLTSLNLWLIIFIFILFYLNLLFFFNSFILSILFWNPIENSTFYSLRFLFINHHISINFIIFLFLYLCWYNVSVYLFIDCDFLFFFGN